MAVRLQLGAATLVFTGRDDGDFAPGADAGLARRRAGIVAEPWTVLRQVHGAAVVTVQKAGDHAGAEADAAVTRARRAPLAILTADCAPIAFASPEGVIGVAHAGWRGLLAGVVENTVAAMRELDATDVHAAVGPCIRPECYEFGPSELDDVASRLGESVRATASSGRPALDLPAAVWSAFRRAGVGRSLAVGGCTACEADQWFSHRARGQVERHALVAWVD